MTGLPVYKISRKEQKLGTLDTNIGTLDIFYVSVKDISNLDKISENHKDSPYTFLKELIKHICFYHKDNGEKLDSPELKYEDIENLNDTDLNKIAEILVKDAEYLYRKPLTIKKKNEEGLETIETKYGEVELPKEENEDYVSYYFRLHKEQQKKFSKLIHGFSLSTQNAIGELLKNTNRLAYEPFKLALGSSMPRPINTPKTGVTLNPNKDSVTFSPPKLEKINTILDSFAKEAIENKQKPFQMVAETIENHMNTLSNLTKESIQTQIAIAGEINKSNQETGVYSKKSIKLNIIVIIISGLAFIATCIGIYISSKTSEASEILDRKTERQILSNIETISNFQEMTKQILSEQKDIIHELKKQNEKQDEIIQELIKRADNKSN